MDFVFFYIKRLVRVKYFCYHCNKRGEMMNERLKNRLIFIVSSLIVLFTSIIILFEHKFEAIAVQNYTPDISATMIMKNQQNIDNANFDWANVEDTNILSVASSARSNNEVVGLITQPEAKIASTVVLGVESESLNLSAGTVRPDQTMGEGNYVLAGHHVPKSEWALFSGIYYNAEPGQKVYITDLQNVYEYTITNVKFVPANAVEIVHKDRWKLDVDGHKAGDPMITLFSCDATGDARIVEFGTLTKVYDMSKDKIPQEAVDGFERAANFEWSRD